ncbi:MAG: carbohydrate ABC transporter permease [Betaproteobacteria bacterium]
MDRRKLWEALGRVGQYLFALVTAVTILAPFYWLAVSSIMGQRELLSVPPHWIPLEPTFERYRAIFSMATSSEIVQAFKAGMVNSLVVAAGTTAVGLVTGTLTAYALARFKFRLRDPLIYAYLFTYMVPAIALVIPLYLIFGQLALIDTKLGLVLLHSTFVIPFVVWTMKGYFQTIPRDLEEAARIDGCTRLGALWRIVLPLVAPGLAATVIFSFLLSWDEFLYALIFTASLSSKTLPVALAEFSARKAVDYGLIAAGGVLAALPPVLLALLFQKWIVKGLTAGGVKG